MVGTNTAMVDTILKIFLTVDPRGVSLHGSEPSKSAFPICVYELNCFKKKEIYLFCFMFVCLIFCDAFMISERMSACYTVPVGSHFATLASVGQSTIQTQHSSA